MTRFWNIRWALWLAAGLRVASIFVLRDFLHPETWEFGQYAHSIQAGLAYSMALPGGGRAPSAFMPPGYVYLLAGLFRVHGDNPSGFLVLALLQAVAGVLLVYVIYRMALLLMGRNAALVSAFLIAVFPSQVYSCNEFHPINFYMPLGCAAVFFLIRYQESGAIRDVVWAGLSMGALLLFRSEAVVLVAIYAAILLFRRGWKPAALLVCLSFLCLAPWTIRNYRMFGKFIPTTDSAGLNLWIGNNPHATGSQHYAYMDFYSMHLQRTIAGIAQDRDFEANKEAAFKRDAEQFILTHPGDEARLIVLKLRNFFLFDPSHEKGRRPVYWVPSVLLTILAVWGAMLRGRKLLRQDLLLTVSIAFAVAVSSAVFVLPRYKIVIDPFLIIFAGVALASRMGMDPSMNTDEKKEAVCSVSTG